MTNLRKPTNLNKVPSRAVQQLSEANTSPVRRLRACMQSYRSGDYVLPCVFAGLDEVEGEQERCRLEDFRVEWNVPTYYCTRVDLMGDRLTPTTTGLGRDRGPMELVEHCEYSQGYPLALIWSYRMGIWDGA